MKYLVIAILLMAYSNTWAQVDSSLPAKTFIMDSSCGVAMLRQCSRGCALFIGSVLEWLKVVLNLRKLDGSFY